MIKYSKGAALIIVLLFSAILTSMATLLLTQVKHHTNRMTIAKEFMQAERNLITDLSHLIFTTQTSPYAIIGDRRGSGFTPSTLVKGINLHGRTFSFRNSEFNLQDMGGLVTIFPLDETRLISYLKSIHWPEDQIFKFIDVLKDWEDSDGFQHVNGAESQQYDVVGYPLNQVVQDVKEFGLFSEVERTLLNKLASDQNINLFSAGNESYEYSPDHLLHLALAEHEVKQAQTERKQRLLNDGFSTTNEYTSGNWVVKVNTSYGRAKSSKMIHLLRRIGEHRPFVVSHWQERTK